MGFDHLNYTHLRSFWGVAKSGSVRGACDLLGLTQPTISKQIGELEDELGAPLFVRRGRGLSITALGETVFVYSDDIFRLGQELADVTRGLTSDRPLSLRVGVSDSVPKITTRRLLERGFGPDRPIQILCNEGKHESLLAQLAVGAVELLLTDRPVERGDAVRAFSTEVTTSTMTVFATPELASKVHGPFPACLEGFPILLPGASSSARRGIDAYLEQHNLHPKIVGEFDDMALLKAFAAASHGAFFASTLVSDEIQKQYSVVRIATIEDIQETVYAVTAERRIEHPAIERILEAVAV